MSALLAEMLGTAILIILGDGVVANVVLQRSKGYNSGWIVIAAGWAFAVTIAVYCVTSFSGAHLNPAVTIALASIGTFPWAKVPGYIVAQIAGGFIGGVLVWLTYLPHWAATPDPEAKLAVFSTAPAIRKSGANLIAEVIGGFMLVFALLAVISPGNFVPGSELAKGFGPVLVGVIVASIWYGTPSRSTSAIISGSSSTFSRVTGVFSRTRRRRALRRPTACSRACSTSCTWAGR